MSASKPVPYATIAGYANNAGYAATTASTTSAVQSANNAAVAKNASTAIVAGSVVAINQGVGGNMDRAQTLRNAVVAGYANTAGQKVPNVDTAARATNARTAAGLTNGQGTANKPVIPKRHAYPPYEFYPKIGEGGYADIATTADRADRVGTSWVPVKVPKAQTVNNAHRALRARELKRQVSNDMLLLPGHTRPIGTFDGVAGYATRCETSRQDPWSVTICDTTAKAHFGLIVYGPLGQNCGTGNQEILDIANTPVDIYRNGVKVESDVCCGRWHALGRVLVGCGPTDIPHNVGHTRNAGYANTAGYATTRGSISDYRLKTNLEPLQDAEQRVNQINAYRFNWTNNPTGQKVDGFIAHEISQLIPEAVIGDKDAVDENGNPVYQKVDYSKVVPILVAANNDISLKIHILKSKIFKLEQQLSLV